MWWQVTRGHPGKNWHQRDVTWNCGLPPQLAGARWPNWGRQWLEIGKGSELREAVLRRELEPEPFICLGFAILTVAKLTKAIRTLDLQVWGNNPGRASLWQKGTEHWKRNFPKKKSIKYLGYRSKETVKFPKQSTQAEQDKPGLLTQFIFKITPKGTGLVLETREGMVVVVQSLGHAWLFATPLTIEHQAPLSSAICQSLLKFISIESVMLSNQLILCRPLLLLPSILPSISIRIFSNEVAFLASK